MCVYEWATGSVCRHQTRGGANSTDALGMDRERADISRICGAAMARPGRSVSGKPMREGGSPMGGNSYIDENGEALELDEEWFKASKRGFPPPPAEGEGRSAMVGLDPDVIEYYRGTGKGWQKRVNDILREAMQ